MVTPEGVRPATLAIAGGVIVAVGGVDEIPPAPCHVDAGDAAVLPGVVDVHVHVNEPGRGEWEGFASATRAAAAGGVTTLVDMPLNSSPVTTRVAALEAKVRAAAESAVVDYGFWGGVVPGNAGEISALLEAGVLGCKCFLVPSGIDEFPHVGEAELRRTMPVLAAHGAVLLAHAEAPEEITRAAASLPAESRRYRDYLAARPPAAEQRAIELLLRVAAATGCKIHIVHLASAEALPALAEARRAGLPVSVETCPHYLTFSAGEIADGDTLLKCAPPIRERWHREGLWRGLGDGVIDLVASDHSPCPPALKRLDDGDFMSAWGGIASLQLTLPALWTEARRRGFDLTHIAAWLAERPARLAGLDGRKGRLAAGCDADFVIFDSEAEFRVEAEVLYHRHKFTPYAGRTLRGVVRRTFLRGEAVRFRQPDVGVRGLWLRRQT